MTISPNLNNLLTNLDLPKTCTKCKTVYKDIKNNFNKGKNFKDGFVYECKKCKKKQGSYNFEGESRKYCVDCKEPGMIDVVNKKCEKCKIKSSSIVKKYKPAIVAITSSSGSSPSPA